MKTIGEILEAAESLTPLERVRLARTLLQDYDGEAIEAVAEARAEEHLGMSKARRGTAGIDGVLPNGRTIQVKSKKAGAHRDSATYVTLSPSTRADADDLLIVFVDYDTCTVSRHIGPVAISSLKERKGRYYISDILSKP